jgi:hypothetical protein
MTTTISVNEYRCTRPDLYSGNSDLKIRQGHYIEAESPLQARQRMKVKYPHDTSFDVQLWKEGGSNGVYVGSQERL